MTELERFIPHREVEAPILTFEDEARLRTVLSESLAPATRRSYESLLRGWTSWCDRKGYVAFPASEVTVAAYLTYLASRPDSKGGKVRPSSIRAIKSVIATAHRLKGLPNPTDSLLVQKALKGIDRTNEGGQVRRARAVTGDEILKMTSLTTDRGVYADARDAALLLIGYGTAMRRSEMVALDVRDVIRRRDGNYYAHIRRSKTDPTARGEDAALPEEAVVAMLGWLDLAGIRRGAIFVKLDRGKKPMPGRRLTDHAVREIVKRRAKDAGLEPPEHEPQFSGHSLRRGAATEADANGASEYEIRDLGRWKSMATVSLYVEHRKRLEHLSEKLGLRRASDAATTTEEGTA